MKPSFNFRGFVTNLYNHTFLKPAASISITRVRFNKKSLTGRFRHFSTSTDPTQSGDSDFSTNFNVGDEKKVALRKRLASIEDSYDKIGTHQTRTAPEMGNDNNSPHDLTIAKMLAAGLHLGSSVNLWNPRTQPFIFGERAGIHIFNLEITIAYLRRACSFTREVAANGGIIVFLTSKREFASAVIDAAFNSNSYYVYDRWIPGTITNRENVLKPDYVYDKTKKRYKTKYYKPDLLIIANYADNKTAVAEATKMNVPTIAIIDSDQNPGGVTYPIPGNDDSVRGIELVLGLLSTAVKEGVQKRKYLDQLLKQEAQ